MWGDDETFVFEGSHVIANRRRRDPELVAIEQRLGTDRLARLDIVLDDGAEDGYAAFTIHGPSSQRSGDQAWHSVMSSAKSTTVAR